MQLERAALIAEVIGGLAVVVSVIYLAIQISDNNRLLRSQSHYNALEVLQRPFEVMLERDDLAEHLDSCSSDPYGVSDVVWSRCVNYIFMQANGWEYIYYQNLDEAVLATIFVGADGYMADQARNNPSWARFWAETIDGFGEPFRAYTDERIRDNPAYKGTAR